MNLNKNHPPQGRVPGAVQKTKEYALGKDLTKLSKRELLDLKSRQQKLLENKGRLQKLPDKGQKIQDLYDRTVKALELRNEIDATSNLLSALNLGSSDVNNLEWNHGKSNSSRNEVLDSDDDEDPLAILTSSNSANKNQRIVKAGEREVQLITDQDLKEAEEIKSSSLHLDPVLEYVCQHENMEHGTQRFLPYKSTKNSSMNSSASSASEQEKKPRDNTAASPPVLNQGTKPLTLRESIEIEHAGRQKMKELKEQQATERLATKARELGTVKFVEPDVPAKKPDASFMSKYRLASSLGDDFDVEGNDSLSDEDEFNDQYQ